MSRSTRGAIAAACAAAAVTGGAVPATAALTSGSSHAAAPHVVAYAAANCSTAKGRTISNRNTGVTVLRYRGISCQSALAVARSVFQESQPLPYNVDNFYCRAYNTGVAGGAALCTSGPRRSVLIGFD